MPTGKFIADFTSFSEAVTKAELDLKKLESGAGKVGGALNRMVDEFSGQKIIQQALLATEAVERVGGATKLTQAEQTKLNSLVTEAIAKYEALGKEAPDSLHAIQAQTSQLVSTVEPLPKHLGNVEEKATLAAKATGFFGSTLAQITSGFTLASLIDRGVGALASWTKEAIDSAGAMVDLSNKTGLSTETLQRMSFVAKQTGSDMEGFSNASFKLGVNLSEGTGKARKAVEDLGLSWQQLRSLSPDEQFATVADALEKMDNAQRRNTDGVTLFGNKFGQIAPAIAGGYSRIAREANVAGDAQLRAIDDLTDAWDKWVEKQKTGIAQAIGSWVIAREELQKLTDEQMQAYQALLRGGGDAQAFLLQLAAAAKKTDINLPVERTGGSQTFVANLKAAEQGYRELTAAQKADIEAALQLNQTNDDIINKLGITEDVLSISKKAYEEHTAAINRSKEAMRQHAQALQDVADAQKPLTESQKESAVLFEALGLSAETSAKALKVSATAISNFLKQIDNQTKVQLDDWADEVKRHQEEQKRGEEETLEALKKLDEERVDSGRAAMDEWNEAVRHHQQEQTKGEQATLDALKKRSKEATTVISDLSKALSDLATVSGGAFGTIASGLGTIVSAANTAQKSIEAMKSGLLKDTTTGKGKGLEGLLEISSGITGIVSAALAAGKAVVALFGLFDRNKGRDLVVDFAETFGGFDALHAKLLELGEEGEKLWVKLTQGTGRNNPEQARQVIEEVTKALEKQAQKTEASKDVTEEQAQATIESATQAQKALEELGPKIAENEALWKEWGDVVTGILQEIATSIRSLPLPTPPGAASASALPFSAGGGTTKIQVNAPVYLDGKVLTEAVAYQALN